MRGVKKMIKFNKWIVEKVGKGIPIYEVGHCGPEHNIIYYRTFRKSKAIKLFQKVRIDLLQDARHMLKYGKTEAKETLKLNYRRYDGDKIPLSKDDKKYYKDIAKNGEDMYVGIVKALKEKDPEKIDNYPHDTPFLSKEYIIF